MKKITGLTYQEERSLYAQKDIEISSCLFEGPSDGESPLKECSNVIIKDSKVSLRYPFWHDDGLKMLNTILTETCRAPIWYSKGIKIEGCTIKGVKALRESKNIDIVDSDINSEEFGWMIDDINVKNTSITSVYPFFRVNSLHANKLTLTGKYSFQYLNNALIEDSTLNTKDAFWHSKNVTVKNSIINGEYLGWYSENLHLINCKIISKQPLCYCKGLVLENCVMEGCDLAFERSEVQASLIGSIDSIKNPISGKIVVDRVKEIILDGDVTSTCEIVSLKAS